MHRTTKFAVTLCLLALMGLSGCKTVEFYQKQRLNDPAMKFDDDPAQTHFVQKTAYSREGSAGGIGTGAGSNALAARRSGYAVAGAPSRIPSNSTP